MNDRVADIAARQGQVVMMENAVSMVNIRSNCHKKRAKQKLTGGKTEGERKLK